MGRSPSPTLATGSRKPTPRVRAPSSGGLPLRPVDLLRQRSSGLRVGPTLISGATMKVTTLRASVLAVAAALWTTVHAQQPPAQTPPPAPPAAGAPATTAPAAPQGRGGRGGRGQQVIPDVPPLRVYHLRRYEDPRPRPARLPAVPRRLEQDPPGSRRLRRPAACSSRRRGTSPARTCWSSTKETPAT